MNRVTLWLLVLAAAGAYLRTFDNPGTGDVTTVLPQWMAAVRANGPVSTFRDLGPDYPPLAFSSLYAMTRVADWLPATDFRVLKTVIVACTFLSVGVFWLWSRNSKYSAALLCTLWVSAGCLGYQDVFYLWSLLLAVVGLQRRHFAIAGCLLALAIGTKWQPLMVAPFFFLEACHPGGDGGRWSRPAWTGLLRFLTGFVAVVAIEGSVFGFDALWTSLTHAVDRPELTAQALNLNWIIHVLLGGGINTPDTGMAAFLAGWATRAGFAMAYVFLLLGFWRTRRSFADFLWFGACGAAVYFTLNTGVHENHLFMALAMSFALLVVEPKTGGSMALFYGVVSNINLLAFYGLDGQPAYYTTFLYTATVLMAAANTAFVLFLLWMAGGRWRTLVTGRPAAAAV